MSNAFKTISLSKNRIRKLYKVVTGKSLSVRQERWLTNATTDTVERVLVQKLDQAWRED